jgi:hypothetical protein
MDDAHATNVQAIIDRARSGDTPGDWNVWSLRRDVVGRDIWSWAGIAAFGFLLFLPAAHVMIPDNFQGDAGKEVISVIILGVLGFMAFGALYLFIADFQRLRQWGEYLLIMTPDDYIKVEPRRITHVPMDRIDSITLKGVRVEQEPTSETEVYSGLDRMGVNRIMGAFRRKPKVSPSLAFRDMRTDAEVIVSRDNSFDDLAALDHVLRLHVSAKERTRPL